MKKINKNKYKKIELKNTFVPESQIDFHQFSRLDSYDVESKLFEFLEVSYAKSYQRILVITGKGQFVRKWVYDFLQKKKSNKVKNFSVASVFNGGEGAFEIELI